MGIPLEYQRMNWISRLMDYNIAVNLWYQIQCSLSSWDRNVRTMEVTVQSCHS
ncbi:hypothetical protein [Acidilutibacter cellobiosedens]|uniref:hypothetical protein n=1 Tax=Acidilutibacter cellobiosedens TaxID=2507161 RepID=UPI00137570F0|nr:hypothetical protein [Acidilutibacter cellobiosedens]